MTKKARFHYDIVKLLDTALRKPLERGEKRTYEWLTQECGIARSSVQRHLNQLRELDPPLENDPHDGWRYQKDTNWLLPPPALFVTEDGLIALALSRKIIQQHAGTPLASALEAMCSRMVDELPAPVRGIPADIILERFSFSEDEPHHPDTSVLMHVVRALTRSLVLTFSYAAKGDAKCKISFRVHPSRLAIERNDWYLYGVIEGRTAQRRFSLSKMRDVKVGKETARYERFDRRKYEIGRCQQLEEKGRLARLVMLLPAAYRKEAKNRPVPNGRLYTVCTYDEDRILVTAFIARPIGKRSPERRWLLSWGSDGCVLHPSSLAKVIEEEASKTLTNYTTPEGTEGRQMRSANIIQLLSIAEANGYLTYADINYCVPANVTSPEEMESYLALLRGMDIDIVDGDFMERKPTYGEQ